MEISKAEVIRRLREAGFTPDAPPEAPLPIIPEAPPPITERHDDEEGDPAVIGAGPGGLAFWEQAITVPTRPMPRDPSGEPWMIWVNQMWSDEQMGVPQTHIRFHAARNQSTYRTEGYWQVGLVVPGHPGPDEFIYHCERELSDLVGHSCRITHFDGRPVVL